MDKKIEAYMKTRSISGSLETEAPHVDRRMAQW